MKKQRSSNPVRKYSETIPVDLLIDIFSRVPAKSIARFRCVSKFWASILARSDFTELFLTKSLNRPRILFAVQASEETLVFSSPQPQNPDENCSLVATRYRYYHEHGQTVVLQHMFGLVYLYPWIGRERVICNPITGKFIILPEQKPKVSGDTNYLCYDPTNKQFKVFRRIWCCVKRHVIHLVLTLETTKLCWRTIECKPYPACNSHEDGICINGVLYYKAYNTIVCFDVGNEKFSFISFNEYDMFKDNKFWILTNYKGKLGGHCSSTKHMLDTELVLWVLEDVVNNKWSKNVCVLTPLREILKDMECNVRVTCAGEIVFSPTCPSNPFYIVYYNFERNIFTRVEIQGMQEFANGEAYITTFLDFVENMSLRSQDDNGYRRSQRLRKPKLKYF